jgi:hypothetical protein
MPGAMWGGLAILVAVQLVACNRSDTGTARPDQTSGLASDVTVVPRAHANAPLMVEIEPKMATVETDLTAVANDTAVTYSWAVNGGVLDGGFTRVLPKTMFRRSDTVLVKIALNAQRASRETTIQNSPPRATEVSLDRPLESVHQGLDLKAVPKGIDADGDDIRWEYQWLVNDEPMVGQTTEIFPRDRFLRGDRVTVRVTPSDGETRGEPYTPVAIAILNGAPEFVSRPPALAGGAEYAYQVQTVDPEGDSVRYRLAKAPEGMVIDSATGMLRWPLIGVTPGRKPVEIEIDDGQRGIASQTFELEIAPPEGS